MIKACKRSGDYL